MTTPASLLTPADLERLTLQCMEGFRTIAADETPSQYAHAAALHAIAALVAATGGQIKGVQDDLPALLARAEMDDITFGTRGVKATDGSGRISVSSSGSAPWGDCLTLGVLREDAKDQGWFEMMLSPARSRILAIHLLAGAEYREAKDSGLTNIDHWHPHKAPPLRCSLDAAEETKS